MVIQSNFQIELVEAKSKTPFKEHYYKGGTYVEVEPDVEFLISRQRTGISIKGDFVITVRVDGRDVGWQDSYEGVPKRDDWPTYDGVWNGNNETGSEQTEECALKFLCRNQNSYLGWREGGRVSMGKVEIELREKGDPIYFNHYVGTGEFAKHQKKKARPTASPPGKQCSKEVRSTVGVATKSQPLENMYYNPGRLIQTITLKYCTTIGLIQIGLLPKPQNIYDLHRISYGPSVIIPPPLVPPERLSMEIQQHCDNEQVLTNVTYCDLFDLTKLDESSEDNENPGSAHSDDEMSFRRKKPCRFSGLIKEE